MLNENVPEIATIWNEAKAYIEQGNYDRAIEIYKYVLLRYGEEPTAVEYANAYLGDIYLTMNRPDIAVSYIEKAIRSDPEKPGYHYQMGFVHSKQRKWAKAIREFEFAVKKSPDNAEYLRGLGWAFFNSGDKPKGLAYLKQALKLSPSSVNILLDLAHVYLINLDFKQAKLHTEQALKIEPENNLAQRALENICHFQDVFDKAGRKGKTPHQRRNKE